MGDPFRPSSLGPIDALRVIVGTLLLIFGLQWLRKAILRAGHYTAFRDEEALYRRELAYARAAGRPSRTGMDWYTLSLRSSVISHVSGNVIQGRRRQRRSSS